MLFVSNASSRGLADEQRPKDSSNSNTTQSPPLPNVTPIGDVKANVTSSLPTSNSTSPDPKEPDSASPPPPPPPQLQAEGEKNVTVTSNTTTEEAISPPPANQTDSVDKGKSPAKVSPPPPKSLESGGNGTVVEAGNTPPPPPPKDPEKGSSESAVAETCAGKSKICRTENSLAACTLSIDKDSSKWSILVQNEGEESLKAKIVLPANSSPELTLTKHKSQRVNISISGDTNKLILDAGKGECVLHMYPPQENTLSIHLPSYEKLVTPINGAYFLIVSVVIFGGAWGFCLCRKNRRADDNGVPYRELELSGGAGLESGHDVETADWDEGWDDDWDENNAVKSPGGAANSARISANGLTARASNRDGWDNDWDD